VGALHNALTRGNWSKALQAALGVQKADGGVERYGETLTPGIDLWGLPEWARLRGEMLAGGPFSVTSAAGTLSEVLLLNPTTNFMATVTRIWWAFDTRQELHYARLNQGTLPAGFVAANSGPVDFRDPRLIATSSTKCILAQAANAAIDGGISFDAPTHSALNTLEDREPIVVGPLTGLILRAPAVGVNLLRGGIRWRERATLPGEL